MAPQPLRGPSRKATAELPQAERVSFLLQAARALAATVPGLSAYLGRQAMQVSVAKQVPLPRAAAFELCRKCGGQLAPTSQVPAEVAPLSRSHRRRLRRRARARGQAAPRHKSGEGAQPAVAIRRCPQCGHPSIRPFHSTEAAFQVIAREGGSAVSLASLGAAASAPSSSALPSQLATAASLSQSPGSPSASGESASSSHSGSIEGPEDSALPGGGVESESRAPELHRSDMPDASASEPATDGLAALTSQLAQDSQESGELADSRAAGLRPGNAGLRSSLEESFISLEAANPGGHGAVSIGGVKSLKSQEATASAGQAELPGVPTVPEPGASDLPGSARPVEGAEPTYGPTEHGKSAPLLAGPDTAAALPAADIQEVAEPMELDALPEQHGQAEQVAARDEPDGTPPDSEADAAPTLVAAQEAAALGPDRGILSSGLLRSAQPSPQPSTGDSTDSTADRLSAKPPPAEAPPALPMELPPAAVQKEEPIAAASRDPSLQLLLEADAREQELLVCMNGRNVTTDVSLASLPRLHASAVSTLPSLIPHSHESAAQLATHQAPPAEKPQLPAQRIKAGPELLASEAVRSNSEEAADGAAIQPREKQWVGPPAGVAPPTNAAVSVCTPTGTGIQRPTSVAGETAAINAAGGHVPVEMARAGQKTAVEPGSMGAQGNDPRESANSSAAGPASLVARGGSPKRTRPSELVGSSGPPGANMGPAQAHPARDHSRATGVGLGGVPDMGRELAAATSPAQTPARDQSRAAGVGLGRGPNIGKRSAPATGTAAATGPETQTPPARALKKAAGVEGLGKGSDGGRGAAGEDDAKERKRRYQDALSLLLPGLEPEGLAGAGGGGLGGGGNVRKKQRLGKRRKATGPVGDAMQCVFVRKMSIV